MTLGMLRDFFASPNFLALLRFWERARAGTTVPDWNGELSSIPAHLLQRLVIVERRETALVYRYLGTHNRRRFGRDPTGATIAETLSAEYAAYLTDLIETVLAGAAPVFSCLVQHPASRQPRQTDRPPRRSLYASRVHSPAPDHERSSGSRR